jgi:iron-sulfur cluster repair protein YtfE (RIC family)
VSSVKRSDALAPLSRQHHQGLFTAMKLKRADAASAAEARAAFVDFWEREGRDHFRVEEEVLLPAYARRGEHDHPAVVRVLVDHVDLRRRGEDVAAAADPDPAALNELGERLEGHIRHEERVLFPLIEEALPPDELARLAHETGHG